MLEKNKDYIEFLMHTMMVTHRPYENDAEIGITGMIPERDLLAANNPFDIPCDVVVVPKREFERLQAAANINAASAKEWKEATGCPSPSSAKTLIESGASWHYSYNQVKRENQKLIDDVESWKEATKCETPEAAATWVTSYESACIRGNNLAMKVAEWKKATGCSTPEEAKRWADKLGEANGNLAQAVLSWQEITGFSTPKNCSSYIDTLKKKLKDIKDLIEED